MHHMEVNMRPIAELATEIFTLSGHINAANHRFLTLLAEFDRRNGWSDSMTQSCAHWLNWKCGIGVGAAREKVRVAR
ncbi:MAG: HNH endonuclease, partial [Steroidobacteraceae bacterium]|nr:HNH endonuclease [Steroidobacteraceae bacterium]